MKNIDKLQWKYLESILINSWWVWLCALLCYASYEKSQNRYHRKSEHYQGILSTLQEKKKHLLMEQESLQHQVNSQSDPIWVELTLIKRLGVIPEGDRKFIFEPGLEV